MPVRKHVISEVPPVKRGGTGRRRKYDWPSLAVGESLEFYAVTAEDCKRAMTSAYGYGKQTGKKFVTRTVDGGVKIWRVE